MDCLALWDCSVLSQCKLLGVLCMSIFTHCTLVIRKPFIPCAVDPGVSIWFALHKKTIKPYKHMYQQLSKLHPFKPCVGGRLVLPHFYSSVVRNTGLSLGISSKTGEDLCLKFRRAGSLPYIESAFSSSYIGWQHFLRFLGRKIVVCFNWRSRYHLSLFIYFDGNGL